MSGVSSNYLFHLIKSLSASEKRYFKLFVSDKDPNPVYLQLFNAMDAQKVPDENKILNTRQTIKASQLSNIKNYLYDAVLESMRNYHAGKNINMQLRSLLDRIEFLYDKRLKEQCLKQIKKAKKLASVYELNGSIIEILDWERKVFSMKRQTRKEIKNVFHLFDETLNLLEKSANTSQYEKIFRLGLETFKKEGVSGNRKDNMRVQRLLQHKLLKNEKNLLSYHDHYYYYSIYSVYHLLKKDWSINYKYQKKIIDLIESHPEQIKYAPNEYLSQINLYLISCQYSGNVKELDKIFQKAQYIFKKHEKSMKPNSLVQVLSCYNSMMHFYVKTGMFEKNLLLYHEIEPLLNFLKPKLEKSFEMSFSYTLAYTHFGMGEFSACLRWLNIILNESEKSKVRIDIKHFARILNLIVHYDLGHTDHLEHLIKTTQQFLQKQGKIDEMEFLLLQFIKQSLKVHTKKEHVRLFISMKKEFLDIQNKKGYKNSVDYFNFMAWIESKIGNKRFSQIAKNIAQYD